MPLVPNWSSPGVRTRTNLCYHEAIQTAHLIIYFIVITSGQDVGEHRVGHIISISILSANYLRSPISSAVILPVESDAPKSPNGKRRQSSTSEQASKRPRLSSDGLVDSPTALRVSPQASESLSQKPEPGERAKDLDQEKRKSSAQEERKRGQRLFGGLLNTLSRSTSNGQQKRRQEIEKRQAEKARQQKHEDEARRTEKLANLKKIRKAEQIKFDEESVSNSHSERQINSLGLY
jgi:hypothetical protein